IGDLLSQPANHGGFGLGATVTSVIFCGGILFIVAYLSVTKRDTLDLTDAQKHDPKEEHGGVWQTAAVVALLLLAGGIGYQLRQSALQAPPPQTPSAMSGGSESSASSALGDLSAFRTITQDTLDLLNGSKQSEATARIGDLEYEWDN